MRCPDCNKFVAYEEAEPEVDLEVSEGLVTGTCRIVLNCQECGQELKEATFDVEVDLQDQFPEKQRDEADFELSDESYEMFSRMETKDRKGKPIKSARYMKTMYGAEVSFKVKAAYPDGTEYVSDGHWSDEIQASVMDELV